MHVLCQLVLTQRLERLQVFCGNHGKSVLSWEPPDKEMISKVVLNSHTGWVRSLATSGKWLFR